MEVCVVVLALLLVRRNSGLLVSMHKPGGDGDLDSVISHVVVMEKTLSSLQSQMTFTTSELSAVKATLKSTQDQLIRVTSDLKLSEAEIAMLKSNSNHQQVQNNLTAIDVLSKDMNTNIHDVLFMKSVVAANVDTINNITASVLNNEQDIAQLKTEVARTGGGELSPLTSQANSSSIELALLRNTVMTLAAKLNSTESTVKTLEGKADNDVSFYVHGPSRLKNLIRFTEVDYNKGLGYQRTSGVFTTPTSGSYVFWANVQLHYAGEAYLFLYKDSTRIAITHTGTTGNLPYRIPTMIVVTHVNRGENISLETDFKYNQIGPFSSFGGVLLHAD